MNILVVDDEAQQIESMRMVLRSSGYKVLAALNAEEALEYFIDDHQRIDLVLTDYVMPGMDGLGLLRQIRANNISLPVIMMTAHGEKDLVIKALNNRCDGFIEKPFTSDELIHEIKRAIAYKFQNTGSHQLSEFIPRVVHQINNPLMAIMGCAELGLLQLDDTESLKNSMNSIIKSINKINGINKRLIKLGWPTKDKIGEVDVRQILNDCLDMFRDLMAFKGISVEKHLGSHHLYVLGDMFDLEQVFKNLILNAIDSMDDRPEKMLKIRVEMDRAASLVLTSIEDTGCGIPEESMDKIFTPYFTGKQNGTGLGLSVVKSILEKHKGEIKVESRVGKGMTVRVTLPIVD